MTTRTILHVDMDAFFASVEQWDHPEMRGKPVVVGSPPDQRGVVAAASYEARRFGIHSAMPSREAGTRCPQAIFVPPNMKRYREVSKQIFAIFDRYTPLVEGLSIDEAFLDVTGSQHLFGTGLEIAEHIRRTIRQECGLTASVGIATNKFLAKLASDMNKPDGITVVPSTPEGIVAFLAPLPVGRLWGVGQVMQGTLEKHGLRTIGDLQRSSAGQLALIVGSRSAAHLLPMAFGQDAREIELDREEKSISREHTFAQDTSSPEALKRVLADCADDVGRRLREAGLSARVAHLKLRWQGFKTITRQKRFERPCADDFSLRHMALQLFDQEALIKPVRLIGFGVSGLRGAEDAQLNLFDDTPPADKRREILSRSVDAIRRKHGPGSIRRGSATERSGGE